MPDDLFNLFPMFDLDGDNTVDDFELGAGLYVMDQMSRDKDDPENVLFGDDPDDW